jgi:L-ascorbate metabolism protein UlaG (beta-lactamase superfamily)
MTGIAIAPRLLTGLAAVTSSHLHTDHFDAATLLPLAAANPGLALVLPAANVVSARDRLGPGAGGLRFVPLDAGATAEAGPFRFTGVAAAHNEVETDPLGRCRFLGIVAEFGGFAVYHSGDTLWHPGLVPALTKHPKLDLALVPVNGNRPERGVAGNLNGTEAAALARAAGAALAVPHHFEMFTFNTEPPDEFEAACARLGQPFRTLRCGERLTVRSDESPS